MAIPVYPAELPLPRSDGYEHTFGDGRGFFRNDAGPPSIRQRFAATADPITFSTRLRRWQLGVLDHFYAVTTAKGSKPFILPDPMIDGHPILDENLEELVDENDKVFVYTETMLVLFADQGLPARSPSPVGGDAYRVSFRLLRLPA